jgi:uncharacterized damage-inducible protein DinB
VSDLDHLRRLLHYDQWANAETLRNLREDAGAPPSAVRWMAHIIGAEFVWLARLREEAPSVPVWPEFDLDACAARLEELESAWAHWLGALDAESLGEGVGYRNTKGEFWTNTMDDVLTHVIVHSAYHRGQIASAVRAGGAAPAYTDFIHAVRQGLVG